MKTLLFLFLFFCCNGLIYAQYSFTLRIINTNGEAMKNVEVSAQNGPQILKATTDVTGTVKFTLTEPGMYYFSYLDMKNDVSCEVKAGMKGNFTRTTTYDPEGVFAIKPKCDRSGITFKTISAQQLRSQANVAKVTLEVKEQNSTKVTGVQLEVTSCSDKTKYQGVSNASGLAVFYLPLNKDYEVDVDKIVGYHQFKVLNYSGLEMHEVIYYEKTKIKEITKGDTIIQNQISQTSGTSSHVLFTLNLKNFDGIPLANEVVYLNAENNKRVYQGQTNDKGESKFMLEKGSNYILNLKYEKGLHLIEATNTLGFASESIGRRYRGSVIIEEMMAEQKAELERILEQEKAMKIAEENRAKNEKEVISTINQGKFVPNYHNTPVENAEMPLNYITKTSVGFDLNFKSAGPIGTPTIDGNKLFTKAGFYSPNFYCLDAKNGNYIWGVELGESGISPVVLHNGVLLINTASCTLYALDAVTGKLLWSKWLSDYIYSTPTASGENVFVVYDHGGRTVLVSFGLKTGKFNWMRTVDNESIACPVVAGEEVHVASQSGTYYVFNKNTGEQISSSTTVHAVSSPTITANKIYLTTAVNGKEQLVELDRKTLKMEKKFPSTLAAFKISGDRDVDTPDQMNFNGSHPIVYQNKVIIVTDKEKIMAFSLESEKLLWQQSVSVHPNQLPIVVNDKVVIATNSGAVVSYDIYSGTSKILQQSKGVIDSQPISHNGFMYIASAGILSVIKSVHNFQFLQWNKNASHNLVWD